MMLSEISVTKDDFDRSGWQTVVAESEQKLYTSYCPRFASKAREAESAGDVGSHHVFTLLNAATSLVLNADSKENPYIPLFVMQGSRSAVIEDFGEDQLELFRRIAPETADPELRARLADILWERKRDYRMAQLAIDAYLDSASVLENPEGWIWVRERIERAFRLSAFIGAASRCFVKVVAYTEALLAEFGEDDPEFISASLMDLLLEFRQGDPAKYVPLAKTLAQRAASTRAWHMARRHWELAARWHGLAKDKEAERIAWINAAETYVQMAEDFRNVPGHGYLAATHHLLSAIEALRRIRDTKERRDELHRTLLEYEEKSISEFATLSGEIDVTDISNRARNAVRRKSLFDALLTLALLGNSPKIADLRQQAQEAAKNHPLQHIVSAVAVSPTGKIVAQKPSMLSGTPEEVEAATIAEMFAQASILQQVQAEGVIEPARYQIYLEHNARVADFLEIVSNNPFVPPGRELIFARGLHAGFTADYLVASHLLIPQLENSLRYLLSRRGIPTSTLDDFGIQQEFDLNVVLDRPEVQEMLGEDLVFDLRGLLVERVSTNLRHKMAHGLSDYDAFISGQAIYLWWVVLRLCLLPVMNRRNSDG